MYSMFESLWLRYLKVLAVCLALAGGYAWVAAEDWEQELLEEQQALELKQQLEQAQALKSQEPEWEPPEYHPQVQEQFGNPYAQAVKAKKTVKKAVVKTKKRVKKAINK